MHIITIIDLEPAGLLVKAYNQTTNSEHFLSPSEAQLSAAGVKRTTEGLTRLADSIDVSTTKEKGTQITSSLPEIRDNKHIPLGADVQTHIASTPAGAGALPALLTTALSELCKAKPAGIEAVQWLGEWLLENNPNQPHVEEEEE